MTAAAKKQQPRAGDDSATLEINHRLLRAAYIGHVGMALAALQEGADVGTEHEATGLTALHIAAGTNNLELVKLLIEKWQTPFRTDRFGRWPSVVAFECRASDALCDYIMEKEAQALGLPE